MMTPQLYAYLLNTPPPRTIEDAPRVARWGLIPMIFVAWVVLICSGPLLLLLPIHLIRYFSGDEVHFSLFILYASQCATFGFGWWMRARYKKMIARRVQMLTEGMVMKARVVRHSVKVGWNIARMAMDHVVHTAVALPHGGSTPVRFGSLVPLSEVYPEGTEISLLVLSNGDDYLFLAQVGLEMANTEMDGA